MFETRAEVGNLFQDRGNSRPDAVSESPFFIHSVDAVEDGPDDHQWQQVPKELLDFPRQIVKTHTTPPRLSPWVNQ